jgi:hypothetical protein
MANESNDQVVNGLIRQDPARPTNIVNDLRNKLYEPAPRPVPRPVGFAGGTAAVPQFDAGRYQPVNPADAGAPATPQFTATDAGRGVSFVSAGTTPSFFWRSSVSSRTLSQP